MYIKIGTLADALAFEEMGAVPGEIADKIKEIAKKLDKFYGAKRDIENSGGGYILFFDEVADVVKLRDGGLDMEGLTIEYVDIEGDYCFALSLMNNEYGVTIVAHRDVMPDSIVNEAESDIECRNNQKKD